MKVTLSKSLPLSQGQTVSPLVQKSVSVLLIGGSERPEGHEWELIRKQWKNKGLSWLPFAN